MGQFRISENIAINQICLDSTPKQGGGQRRITIFYDGWGQNATPNVVIGAKALSDSFAKIVDKTYDPKRRRVAVTIEAVPNAKGHSYIWDAGGSDKDMIRLIVGKVTNHTGMKFDLIADLGRSENTHDLWVYERIFDPANNDLGTETEIKKILADWQKRLKDQPLKQNTDPINSSNWNCGDALSAFTAANLHDFHSTEGLKYYYSPMKPNAFKQQIKDIKFLNAEIKDGTQRMKEKLAKSGATRLFVVHHSGFSTDGSGRIKASNLTHYLTVVGCNDEATEFLVIDPWPGGLQMKYKSGIFDDGGDGTQARFMGMLRLSFRHSDLSDAGRILATFQPSGGAHEYIVLKGG
jgi:hypothetical protein